MIERGVPDRAAEVFSTAGAWLLSDAMAGLIALFGERLPADRRGGDDLWLHLNEELPDWVASPTVPGLSAGQVDLLRRTLAIEREVADDFNFRDDPAGAYRERSQARTADFSDAVREQVLEFATTLGLVGTSEPRHRSYDRTLVLGGGYRSPLLRARYAAQLQRNGVDLGELSFLGSPRFLTEQPPEQPVADTYAPGATDEFDLMVGAAQTEFGLHPVAVEFVCGCASDADPCPAWPRRDSTHAPDTPPAFTHERRVDLVDSSGALRARAYSAGTGRPPHRPQTSDTFDLWARSAGPKAGERVLVVTTRVFVPFQTFDALRLLYLPYGLEPDVIGLGAEWGDRPETAEYLLQETLSGIRSARRLLIEAAETITRIGAHRPPR
ncbi:hypothetical protein [Cryptosporangium phraense]|uniref:Uncharacterized protein n=1 Tax=Cryptosporangium phraense TaxID=2593070 RepID=A0A545AG96_9ACTN|nr:hypothetical protein [Cryptosporangium phraense]TQS40321.1 hypothetical protein FL583_35485 [Cryptosporangium phraense]